MNNFFHIAVNIVAMIYIAFVVKILMECVPFLFNRKLPIGIIVKSMTYSFLWPKELFESGLGEFISYHILGIQPWVYRKNRFEKSKRRKIYEGAGYFIYRARKTECRINEDHKNDPFLKALSSKNCTIKAVIAWLPRIKGYKYFLQHDYSGSLSPDIEDDIPYHLDQLHGENKTFFNIDECVNEIRKHGIDLPQEMIILMLERENIPSTSKVHYFDSYWHKKMLEENILAAE
ncbi:MAG: hypothetical protein EPO11_07765 [Gammaproteobacteria bacterium]|nr:MAG: hypothetical protein EPO11_07765 [Gammaproteobacteria bacterium]